MPIYQYQRVITPITTYQISLPDVEPPCQELATIDGVTYVFVPTGAVLPAQHAEISASVALVTLTDELRAQIIAASPHCALIDERMRQQIRDAYPLEDELKFARIGVGAAMGMYSPTSDEVQGMTVFGEFVEGVRQWGRAERAKLGL